MQALFGIPPIRPMMFAVCMCTHPRLGDASTLSMIDADILRIIVRKYEQVHQ